MLTIRRSPYVRPSHRSAGTHHVVVLDDPVDRTYLVDEIGPHQFAGLLALEGVARAVKGEVEVVGGAGRRRRERPEPAGRVGGQAAQQGHGENSAHVTRLDSTATGPPCAAAG